MFWKNNKKKEVPKLKLQLIQAEFKTTDGEIHKSYNHGWFNVSCLSCNAVEYLMMDFVRDGYIEGNDNAMYPLTNVISIKWDIVDEKEIPDNGIKFPKIIYSSKDIENCL